MDTLLFKGQTQCYKLIYEILLHVYKYLMYHTNNFTKICDIYMSSNETCTRMSFDHNLKQSLGKSHIFA